MPHIVAVFTPLVLREEANSAAAGRGQRQSWFRCARVHTAKHAGEVLSGGYPPRFVPPHDDCAEPRVTRRVFRDPLPRHPKVLAPIDPLPPTPSPYLRERGRLVWCLRR